MKLLDIFVTANSNMMRSKLRSSLTIVAIFIGAFTLTLTNGIGAGIAAYIDEQLGNVGAEDVLVVQGKSGNPFSGGPQKYDENVTASNFGGVTVSMLTQKDVENIRSVPGILGAEFDISATADYIQWRNHDKFKITPNAFVDGLELTLAAGGSLTNRTSELQLVLPVTYISPMGFGSDKAAVNQMVDIGVRDSFGQKHIVKARVTGVQEQTLMSTGGIIVNRPLARAMYNIQTQGIPDEKKNQQPAVVARFDKNISEEQLQRIKNDLDKRGYSAQTIQDTIGIFKQVISAIIAVMNFFAAIALLAASFGIVNTLLMAVQERTKEIGLMKAMGMSRNKIFLLFSVEATLLGLWGSLLGSLAGIGTGILVNQIASETFLKDLAGFDLTSFSLVSTATIMLIIMAIAFVAGTLPARQASRKDPIEALRYE